MVLSFNELFYMALGLISVAAIYWCNWGLFREGSGAAGLTALEGLYYLVAFAALIIGWYFNLQYFRDYPQDIGWVHWTSLLFVNAASASGGQDLIFANLILFPLWTIVDGRRLGMRASWLYFPMSLLTSFAFAMALFLAIKERHQRAVVR